MTRVSAAMAARSARELADRDAARGSEYEARYTGERGRGDADPSGSEPSAPAGVGLARGEIFVEEYDESGRF